MTAEKRVYILLSLLLAALQLSSCDGEDSEKANVRVFTFGTGYEEIVIDSIKPLDSTFNKFITLDDNYVIAIDSTKPIDSILCKFFNFGVEPDIKSTKPTDITLNKFLKFGAGHVIALDSNKLSDSSLTTFFNFGPKPEIEIKRSDIPDTTLSKFFTFLKSGDGKHENSCVPGKEGDLISDYKVYGGINIKAIILKPDSTEAFGFRMVKIVPKETSEHNIVPYLGVTCAVLANYLERALVLDILILLLLWVVFKYMKVFGSSEYWKGKDFLSLIAMVQLAFTPILIILSLYYSSVTEYFGVNSDPAEDMPVWLLVVMAIIYMGLGAYFGQLFKSTFWEYKRKP